MLLDEHDPDEIEAAEKRRVRDGLGMAAEEHRHPDEDREREAAIRRPLEQQIDGVERGRQHRGDGDEREVQPDMEERAERERQRADRGRQFTPSPAATEEIGERERDQQLERGLGRERVAEGERQCDQTEERERRALAVRQ